MGRNNQNSKWSSHQQLSAPKSTPKQTSKPEKVNVPKQEESLTEVKLEPQIELPAVEVPVEEPVQDLKPIKKGKKVEE